MSWLDDLSPASYNGVKFFVSSSDMPFGRRVPVSQFPYRDDAWIDDLGAEHKALRVTGFLIDDINDDISLSEQRQALFDELNKSGNGQLIHPRLGDITVQPGACRWSTKGGREVITLMFHPPAAPAQPTVNEQTQQRVDAAALSTAPAIADNLVKRVKLTTGDLIERAQTVVSSGLNKIRSINASLDAAIAPISEIQQQIDSITDNFVELINKPREFVSAITGVYKSVYSSFSTVSDAMSAYRSSSDSFNAISPVTGITPTRVQEAQNQTALIDTIKTIATVEAIRFVAQQSRNVNADAVSSPFDSYDSAVVLRDDLITTIDTISETADQLMFAALTELRITFAVHLDKHGVSLPRVSVVHYQNALPALVISHILYGDISHTEDIFTRNLLSQPLHIEAGTRLEVLKTAA